MTAFDQIEYTKISVESILRNSSPYKIGWFLLDNGSRTGETYSYFSRLKPEVLGRNPANLGIAAAWNFILGAALDRNPDLICLVSNDVRVAPNWLMGPMRESANPELRYFVPNGQFTYQKSFDYDVLLHLELMRSNPVKVKPARYSWIMFFRPETVRKFLPIPERLFLWYNDDYIHWILQHKHGYRLFSILDSCAIHFGSRTIESIPGRDEIIKVDKEFYDSLKTGERRNGDGSLVVDDQGRTVLE